MAVGCTRDYAIGMDIRLDTYIGGDVSQENKRTIYVVEETVLDQDILKLSLRELTSRECAGRIVFSLLDALVGMITLGMAEGLLREA